MEKNLKRGERLSKSIGARGRRKVAKSINLDKIFTYGYDISQYRFYPLIELNFLKEATLKKHKKINGKLIDILIYSKVI